MNGNKAKLKRASLALLRCKLNIFIFEFGLIAVKNDFQIFRACPNYGANHFFEFSSLALLRCKMTFKIIEFGLIAVQIGLAFLPCTSVI